ncbi:hypothetical protein FD724_02020 [Nostoc sp. C057]|uniref:Rieske (2Fe-2S) protein n=1 Tax=Nostoc sp. C057 TaxID=2576903 RepID=UPI0015C38C97|nr:hypothetical protein [Nostoc sp. C057]QLE47036.1 hypothetical protein FD724_02020 [Nostoc sp. C057]
MTQIFEGTTKTDDYIRVAQLAEVQAAGSLLVHKEKHTIALFYSNNTVYAIDNRCPHMGLGAMRFCEVLKIRVLNHLFRGAIAAK